jgi:hypothetical protein
MTLDEVQREAERVESAVDKNIEVKDIQGYIARGVWAIAVLLAQLVQCAENTK